MSNKNYKLVIFTNLININKMNKNLLSICAKREKTEETQLLSCQPKRIVISSTELYHVLDPRSSSVGNRAVIVGTRGEKRFASFTAGL